MKTIFAITCSSHYNSLHEAKLFATYKSAHEALSVIANERRGKLGVDIIEETAYTFAYLMGWEEKKVRFSIVELSMAE